MNANKPKNKYRISVATLANDYGYDSREEFLNSECNDSVMPACCTEGCEVEPDGNCEHGCPSPLVALGYI